MFTKSFSFLLAQPPRHPHASRAPPPSPPPDKQKPSHRTAIRSSFLLPGKFERALFYTQTDNTRTRTHIRKYPRPLQPRPPKLPPSKHACFLSLCHRRFTVDCEPQQPVVSIACSCLKSPMSALRGALSSLYAHNAAESKKAREDTRVSKMIRESDRQFYQQVVPCSQHFVYISRHFRSTRTPVNN